MKQSIMKYLFLFWFGGSFYVTLETIYRARSHWTMLLLAGIVFIFLGRMNQVWGWEFPLIWQILIGTAFATVAEFVTGCIVNLWLGLNVWDYSNLPFSIYGQVCPQFTLIWMPVVLIGIVLDDVICWRFYGEENPRYWIGNKCFEIK